MGLFAAFMCCTPLGVGWGMSLFAGLTVPVLIPTGVGWGIGLFAALRGLNFGSPTVVALPAPVGVPI
jgi:hypothetical protein